MTTQRLARLFCLHGSKGCRNPFTKPITSKVQSEMESQKKVAIFFELKLKWGEKKKGERGREEHESKNRWVSWCLCFTLRQPPVPHSAGESALIYCPPKLRFLRTVTLRLQTLVRTLVLIYYMVEWHKRWSDALALAVIVLVLSAFSSESPSEGGLNKTCPAHLQRVISPFSRGIMQLFCRFNK